MSILNLLNGITNYMNLEDGKMEFITHLTESKTSKQIKEVLSSHGDSSEDIVRMYNRLSILSGITLSIQASYGHYCTPRKTVALSKYKEMEIAIIKGGGFADISEVTSNDSLIKEFEVYNDGGVYGYVPVELIEKLYKDLMVSEYIKMMKRGY